MLMMAMRMAGQRTFSEALCAAAPLSVVLKTMVRPIMAFTGVKMEAFRYGQKRITEELLASHSAWTWGWGHDVCAAGYMEIRGWAVNQYQGRELWPWHN